MNVIGQVGKLPLVSVIIPTRNRPVLLKRAIRSVLDQSIREIELIVVVDGPDESTVGMLGTLADRRLRVVVNSVPMTAAGARNRGAMDARSEWIAFLDDDDEWLPSKLERQISLSGGMTEGMVSCLSWVITPRGTYLWPEQVYDGTVCMADYLFNRRSVFAGSSFMQTSSYLVRRSSFYKALFRIGTPHDDWDFLLRLSAIPGVRIEVVPEVLVKVYFEQEHTSLSTRDHWRASVAWIDEMTALLTPGAYSGFCLGVAGPRAAHQGDYSAFPLLLYKAFAKGSPPPLQVLRYLAFWMVPQNLRRTLRAAFRRHPD